MVYTVPCRRVDTPPTPAMVWSPSRGGEAGAGLPGIIFITCSKLTLVLEASRRLCWACNGPKWGQQTYGESTSWVLLALSSFWLQVDPTWWLQDVQNHAPTIGVLAPLPPFSLPQHGYVGRQPTYGESTSWVLLALSSFWLQVDPTWWLQDVQNHAPTIAVLAPLPPFSLPQHGYVGRQPTYGESTSWVLLALSSFWLQVDPTWWLQDVQNHAPTIGESTSWVFLALSSLWLQVDPTWWLQDVQNPGSTIGVLAPLPPFSLPQHGYVGRQPTYGESTSWVLLALSSFWLQVDPTWWLQDVQNHAPTIAVLAPLPPFSLPQHGYVGRQPTYGESTSWVLLALSSFWLQVDPTWWLQDVQNHAPTIGESTSWVFLALSSLWLQVDPTWWLQDVQNHAPTIGVLAMLGDSQPMVRAHLGSSWHYLHSGSKLTPHGGFKMSKIMLPP